MKHNKKAHSPVQHQRAGFFKVSSKAGQNLTCFCFPPFEGGQGDVALNSHFNCFQNHRNDPIQFRKNLRVIKSNHFQTQRFQHFRAFQIIRDCVKSPQRRQTVKIYNVTRYRSLSIELHTQNLFAANVIPQQLLRARLGLQPAASLRHRRSR